jgi:hypothetical protein
MIKELENKIGQLQYEISLLGLDQEDLTGVTIRTDELKDLVKNLSLSSVSQQRELLLAYNEEVNQCMVDSQDILDERDVNEFLANNCG